MLIRLGRWLRAAGYDTEIAGPGIADRELIDHAVREDRLLITRDRKLAEYRAAPKRVVTLDGNGMAACVRELSERLAIDWLHDPFSRCVLCNTRLVPASLDRYQQVPKTSLAMADEIRWCPGCDKVYWPGGHVRRMRGRLLRWSRREFA
jgi:uncharacterized protein with PIN domain